MGGDRAHWQSLQLTQIDAALRQEAIAVWLGMPAFPGIVLTPSADPVNIGA
jgi:hypothetical protein